MEGVRILQAFWVLVSLGIIAVTAIPSLSSRFLLYGARTHKPRSTNSPASRGQRRGLLDQLATLTVPHSYFLHFYILSSALCLTWCTQLLWHGAIFTSIAPYLHSSSSLQRPVSRSRLALTQALLLAQSTRRLYECLTYTKPSASRMWLGHYVIGSLFYFSINVATWAEAIPTILSAQSFEWSHLNQSPVIAPSLRTFVALPLFILASGAQHDAHHFLSTMKRYAVPEHPLWNVCLSPHYLAEIVIYVALTIISAGEGSWVNWTVAAHLLFVTVNLSVTALGTQKWYQDKFGSIVGRRAAIVPGIL